MSLFRYDAATRDAVMKANLGRRTGLKRSRKPKYADVLERYFPKSSMPTGFKAFHPRLIKLITYEPAYSHSDVPATPPDGLPVDPRITSNDVSQNSSKRPMPVDIPDDQKMARRSNFSRRK